MMIRVTLKRLILIVGSIALSVLLHGIVDLFYLLPQQNEWSILVEKLGFFPVLLLWYGIAFFAITLIFEWLNCSGFKYGIAISGLWIVGMLEGVSTSGHPVMYELLTGICDGLPIFLMCYILGFKKMTKDQSKIFDWRTCLVFVLAFSGLRYIFYELEVLKSDVIAVTWIRTIWSLGMGAVIYLCYQWLYDGDDFKFICVTFGLNWLVFVCFMPFMFKDMMGQSMLRIFIDISAVAIACKFRSKKTVENMN